MGLLGNAATLLDNERFRNLVRAAAVYQATKVLEEPSNTADYAIRRKLAVEVLNNPPIILERLTAIMAGSPTVAVSDDPDLIPDDAIVQRVATVWTALAQIVMPA